MYTRVFNLNFTDWAKLINPLTEVTNDSSTKLRKTSPHPSPLGMLPYRSCDLWRHRPQERFLHSVTAFVLTIKTTKNILFRNHASSFRRLKSEKNVDMLKIKDKQDTVRHGVPENSFHWRHTLQQLDHGMVIFNIKQSPLWFIKYCFVIFVDCLISMPSWNCFNQRCCEWYT